MVSAVMQSVSGEKMGVALAKEGGIAFIYVSQPIAQQAEMVRKVKASKAGFVVSDSNLRLDNTMSEVVASSGSFIFPICATYCKQASCLLWKPSKL